LGLGLAVGAGPTLALLVADGDAAYVLLSAATYAGALLGWSSPVLVLGWLLTRQWRIDYPAGAARTPAQAAAAALGMVGVFALALAVDTPLDDDLDDWIIRVLLLWAVGSLLVLWRGLSPRDVGLGVRLSPRMVKWLAAAWVVAVAVGTYSVRTGREELIFMLEQWPLNPLAEELVFRGLLLAMLVTAMGCRGRFAGASFGWPVVVVGVMFVLGHQFPEIAPGSAPLDLSEPGTLAGRATAALMVWWVYARTGSLWPAVTAHALFNSVFAVFPLGEILVTGVLIVVVAAEVIDRRRRSGGTEGRGQPARRVSGLGS
jgi:membrane protease YdiL (CAAX protease family)